MTTRLLLLFPIVLLACDRPAVSVDGGAGGAADLAGAPDLAMAAGLVGSWTATQIQGPNVTVDGTFELTLAGGPATGAVTTRTTLPFGGQQGCSIQYVAEGTWMALDMAGRKVLAWTMTSGTTEPMGCKAPFDGPKAPLDAEALRGQSWAGEYTLDATTLTFRFADGRKIVYART